MANYNKSYNFQNGIQVDTDKFVVNAAGLVGLGTTIPRDNLEVYGSSTFRDDVNVTGLVTSTNFYATGISTILGSVGIGTTDITQAADSNNNTVLNAGIVTANFYYGSGLYLNDVVGYTTEGWVVNQAVDSGVVRSGIATNLKVGIGTEVTYEKYDLVIGSDPSSGGEGISFDGGTGNIESTGIITATSFSGIGSNITEIPNSSLDNSSVSFGGVSVSLGAVDATPAFDLTDATNYPYTSLTGISTEILGDSSPQLGGNLDLNSNNITGIGSISISGIVTAADFVGGGINTTGVSTFTDLRVTNTSEVEGVTTAYDDIKLARLDGGSAGLSTYWGELRYGNENAAYPYSTRRSVDILNYDTGNVNFYLNAANRGGTLGNFFWHKGSNNTRLMTLTNDGKLGIGITEPEQPLHVSGISTFDGAVFTSSNVTVGNNLEVKGGLTLSTGEFTGNVNGNLTGNVNSTAGLSTFFKLEVDSKVGIGTTVDNKALEINGSKQARFYVSTAGRVGIATNLEYSHGLTIPVSTASIRSIGVGTQTFRSALDFADAGATPNDANASVEFRFMLPPQVTTAQRTGLTTVTGGMIYNISSNAIQVYDGSTWSSFGGAGASTGIVNILDYGADASATDGTNVTAINNAITALGTNGGTVYFPGGEFYLNAAIELTQAANENSIRFVGTGQQNYGGGSDTGGTVLRRDADDEFFNITNSRAIHFIGITFKGGAAGSSGGDDGISGGNGAIYVEANDGCQGYLIENCVFYGIVNCITFKGLSDSIIRGCRFRNVPTDKGAGQLIKLDENGSEPIDQIRIQDCVGDGYKGTGSAVLNSVVDGISIYNTVNTIFVTNTSMIRLKRSFATDSNWDGNFIYFQNCEAERATGDGFSLNGTGNFITLDNCFACTCGTVNGVDGATGDVVSQGINILTDQNSSVNITNPNVRDNTGHGILFDGTNNNYSVVNPAIGGNSKNSSGTYHGIGIGTGASNVYIAGGKIGGTAAELAGTGTQDYGILVDGTTHSNIRIIGTNVTGNQEADGISMTIASGTGNKVSLNSGSSVSFNT